MGENPTFYLRGPICGTEPLPKRRLARGLQHSSFDILVPAGAYMVDWVAKQLGGRTA